MLILDNKEILSLFISALIFVIVFSVGFIFGVIYHKFKVDKILKRFQELENRHNIEMADRYNGNKNEW